MKVVFNAVIAVTLVWYLCGCAGTYGERAVVQTNKILYQVHDGINDHWQEPLDDAIPLDDFRIVFKPKVTNPRRGYIGIKFTF